MSIDKDFLIVKKQSKYRWIFWIILAIIVFITIYFPFFAPTLRFETSQLISEILTTLGMILVPVGSILLVWGIMTTICSKSFKGVGIALIGFLFLYFGSWCTGGTFGLPIFGDQTSGGGYHSLVTNFIEKYENILIRLHSPQLKPI